MRLLALATALVLLCGAADARFVLDSAEYGKGCYAAAASDRDASRGIRMCSLALASPGRASSYRAAILVNRGIILMRSGRSDAAIADYDAALALVPDLPEALVNKGVAYLRAGRAREAVDLLTAGIAAGPERPEVAYYQRGIANEAIGATGDAYRDYVEAKTLAPGWPSPAEELKRFQVVRRPSLLG